jgi:hypothetical protein
MRVALVTIAIGEKYIEEYKRIFAKNTEDYCNKHGYDFFLLTEYLLPESYRRFEFINIQKWMIPFQEKFQSYDRVVVVDADILITPHCPPIESVDLEGKIGIIDEYTQPTPDVRFLIQKHMKWEDNPTEYFKYHIGIPLETKSVFNGGFYICSPKEHGPFFKEIFERHVDGTLTCLSHPFHYEQAYLSYELMRAQNYKILDNKWNTIWFLYNNPVVQTHPLQVFYNSYVIHFTAKVGWDLASELAKLR